MFENTAHYTFIGAGERFSENCPIPKIKHTLKIIKQFVISGKGIDDTFRIENIKAVGVLWGLSRARCLG